MLGRLTRWAYFCSILIGIFFLGNNALAVRFPLPPKGNDLFGKLQFARVKKGDDFEKIARRYDVGFYELVEANPYVNPAHLKPNTILIVPTQYLLPHVARTGIIINLAAMRLFYFPEGKNYFYTYPVGIGKQNWSTPLGELHIIQKTKDPVWIVPNSVFKYRRAHGDPVPKIVQAGPDNPLGKYAMRLSIPTYLIHGTNEPDSVGRRSSAGCIHLYPEDIKQLFAMTPLRTRVFIMNQPYLAGWNHDNLYVEAHLPLVEERKALTNVPVVVKALITSLLDNESITVVDWKKADRVVEEHTGIPTQISNRHH